VPCRFILLLYIHKSFLSLSHPLTTIRNNQNNRISVTLLECFDDPLPVFPIEPDSSCAITPPVTPDHVPSAFQHDHDLLHVYLDKADELLRSDPITQDYTLTTHYAPFPTGRLISNAFSVWMAACKHLLDPVDMALMVKYPDYFECSNDRGRYFSTVAYRRISDRELIATILFAPPETIMLKNGVVKGVVVDEAAKVGEKYVAICDWETLMLFVGGKAAVVEKGLWRRGMLGFLMGTCEVEG
jgi:hypothetical protein